MPELGTSGSVGTAGEQSPAVTRPRTAAPVTAPDIDTHRLALQRQRLWVVRKDTDIETDAHHSEHLIHPAVCSRNGKNRTVRLGGRP
jgi:hypothetical protein